MESPEREWIVRFINLPPQDQIDFLFRLSLEEEVRERVEKKVFGNENK
jgi:hypothetical protein